jgi:hypothetical protein
MAYGFDPNAFQNSQFQTSGPPPAPPGPPPPFVASGFAISGAARSGAFRSGYLPPQNILLVKIGDRMLDPVANPIEQGTIQVSDNQNDTQDTCSFEMWGKPPELHQEIVIASGTFAKRLFGGVIQNRTQYSMAPGNPERWLIDCVDWWARANRRRIYAKYLTFPADVILKDLISRFTRGFTFNHVKPAPNITGGIEFDGDDIQGAVGKICNRIDWDCYIDAHRDYHFFDLELTRARSLLPGRYHYWDLKYSENVAQIRNRVFQEAGGGTSTAQVLANATSIPVDVVSWYPLSGPNMRVVHGGQIIPYTGIVGNSLTVPAGAITHVIPQGEEISLFVQVDDLDSQAEIAAIEGGDSDGIYEYTASVDHRLSEQGAIDKATAELNAYGKSVRGGTYKTFDAQARSGRMVDILIPYRGGQLRDKRFTIQSVQTRVIAAGWFEKTVTFGSGEKLDIYTALRGGIR